MLAGRQSETGRVVAVKVVESAERAADVPLAVGETLLGLDHPHLAKTMSVVRAGTLCLIVTELLPGGSLAGRHDLAGAVACAVVVDVAEGLAVAHAAGLVHRGLTPTNILLTAGGQPKLTDLGVALLAGGWPPDAAELVVGNPRYLAPEQITGAGLSAGTDVYALAATLYELLAGVSVFGDGLTTPERLRHHCEVVPSPPAGAGPAVAAVLGRALAKAPGDRHRDAADFAAALAGAALADYGPGWRPSGGSLIEVPPASPARDAAGRGVADRAVGTAILTAGAAIPPQPSAPDRTLPLPGAAPASSLGSHAADAGRTRPMQGPAAPPDAGSSAARVRPLRRAVVPVVAGVAAALIAAAVVLPLALSSRAGSAAAVSGAVGPGSSPAPAYAAVPGAATPKPPRVSVVTVAGTGATGFAGDGGPATAAKLNGPLSPAVDAAGDVYIPDYGNNVVRRVSPDGTITTVAGDGTAGFSGDGGPATAAELDGPAAVAVDAAGNLYISEVSNNRIRRVSATGIITTFAGRSDDGPGTLLGDIAAPATASFGDGGPATQAYLFAPIGLAFDGSGDLLVADSANNRIRRISPAGVITTVAGGYGRGSYGDGGPATQALLDDPYDVALDSAGRVYVADQYGHRIRRIDLDGTIETIAGTGMAGFSGDGGPATAATLRDPRGVVVDAVGDVFIDDRENHRIREVTTAGTILTIAGTVPPGETRASAVPGLLPDGGMAVDAAGRTLYVADRGNNRIVRITLGSQRT
ncbi:protein kinase [Frankia sp. AgB1.8]|uniref:NHL domain-containing protein n=1 Tax=Frankia sp. AgB1.8 TaxID=2792839 RepID=UPI0019345E21|nr:protein kinase [Frankia sp. AgB1.8]MBL7618380.1 protein kinase [Frankia sp. AgB1.8]